MHNLYRGGMFTNLENCTLQQIMDSWRVAAQGPGWNIKVVQLMPPPRRWTTTRRGCDVIMLHYKGERTG